MGQDSIEHLTIRDALAQARAFGFLGPGPVEDHIEAARAFEAALGDFRGSALDLGSGGGVPGLVLAAAFPESRWTLLDASRRRAAFLQEAIGRLGLGDRVCVVRGRAEAIGHVAAHRGQYDAVTSRSFGPPSETAEFGGSFLRVGGCLLVSEPPVSADDSRWDGAERLGLRLEAWFAEPVRLVVFRRIAELQPHVPRPIQQVRRTPFS